MLLTTTCYSDIKQRVISNNMVCLIAISSGIIAAIAINNELYPLGWWLIIQPLSVLVVGFGLFALGICGAGDVKLMTALSIIIYPAFWWQTLLLITAIGSVLAIGYLFYGWLIDDLAKVRKKGLPYGVAISFGVFSSVIMSPIITELS